MGALRKYTTAILKVLVGASLGIMTILVCWQVFTRYILNNSATWTEEMVSYMFAWSTLLGASLVFAERGHMNIPVVVQKFKPETQRTIAIVGEILILIFSATVLVFGGIKLSSLGMGQMTSSLGVPIGVFYTVVPISGVLNIIFAILNIVDLKNGKFEPFPADQ